MKDWVAWHAAYGDPSSSLSTRLRLVRGHLCRALDRAPAGPVRLVSLCAGQGLDVLGVLPEHPRGRDVSAVLVESDPHNGGLARRGAAEAGLSQVEVRVADASRVANYAGALPADVLLLCGIFGNVSEGDIQRTAQAAPDLTPRIREWFRAGGFEEVAFDPPGTEAQTGVGVGRLAAAPRAGLPRGPLFTFLPA